MEKLEAALETCRRQCDALRIPYGKVNAIYPSTKVNRRWGMCYYRPYGSDIEISKVLLDSKVEEIHLLDTVMHELLHTCPGCQNHGAQWKRYATMVNTAYGYHVKRGSSYAEMGLTDPEEKTAKYRFKCQSCGAVITRQRASAFTRNPDGYRCGACRGKLVRV